MCYTVCFLNHAVSTQYGRPGQKPISFSLRAADEVNSDTSVCRLPFSEPLGISQGAPGPGTRQLGTAPVHRSLPKLFEKRKYTRIPQNLSDTTHAVPQYPSPCASPRWPCLAAYTHRVLNHKNLPFIYPRVSAPCLTIKRSFRSYKMTQSHILMQYFILKMCSDLFV